MFKDGLATKWLFKESDTKSFSVPLITKQNADLYSTIWNNLVSGPSLVFHRFYEKGKTFIKQEKYQSETLTCDGILGYAANGLYLYSAQCKISQRVE